MNKNSKNKWFNKTGKVLSIQYLPHHPRSDSNREPLAPEAETGLISPCPFAVYRRLYRNPTPTALQPYTDPTRIQIETT